MLCDALQVLAAAVADPGILRRSSRASSMSAGSAGGGGGVTKRSSADAGTGRMSADMVGTARTSLDPGTRRTSMDAGTRRTSMETGFVATSVHLTELMQMAVTAAWAAALATRNPRHALLLAGCKPCPCLVTRCVAHSGVLLLCSLRYPRSVSGSEAWTWPVPDKLHNSKAATDGMNDMEWPAPQVRAT